MREAFNGFKMTHGRNQRIKRVTSGIFDRNIELDIYTFYQKIRHMYMTHRG